MVQRTSSTQFDPKYPWLTDYPFVGAEDPPNPDPNKPPDPDPSKPPEPDKPPVTVDPAELAAELERVRARMTAADQRASAAEKKLQAAEDKDKSELEIAQRTAAEAKAEADAAREELKQARIQNAFLSDNTHNWHSSAAALKLLDLEGVTISEDGKVSGLPAALAKLAREHPYLLKAAETGGDGKPPASGDPKDGKGGSGDKNKPDAKALAKTFPALNSRI